MIDGKMKYLGGKQGEQRDVWVKSQLEPGQHYIFVRGTTKLRISRNYLLLLSFFVDKDYNLKLD